MSTESNITEIFKDYEDGKHRRYSLLFAVNGGAFAVATASAEARTALGCVGLVALCLGMVAFTVLMVIDIFVFGFNMRSALPRDALEPNGKTIPVFCCWGQRLLVII